MVNDLEEGKDVVVQGILVVGVSKGRVVETRLEALTCIVKIQLYTFRAAIGHVRLPTCFSGFSLSFGLMPLKMDLDSIEKFSI